jgi:hypothetical protein
MDLAVLVPHNFWLKTPDVFQVARTVSIKWGKHVSLAGSIANGA